MLLPPIRIPTTPLAARSNHQQDAYPRRSSLPASLRDIMHTSITPPTSTQVTENEESSSSSGTDQDDDTPDFNDPNPRVTQLASILYSALNTTTTNHGSMPIPIVIMSNHTQREETSAAFTFSFQIHGNHHHYDTRDTIASVDMDMDPSTIGHVADIVNAICESLSFDV